MAVDKALAAAYRTARRWQMDCANDGRSSLTDDRFAPADGLSRMQVSYGGAPYQEHALSAFWSARRSLHFRATFAADMKQHRRRSKAARKGWKTRRENA